MKNQVQLHRVLKAPTEKVYRAFSNPDAKAVWLPPFGFICKVHSFEFKEGGRYKMSFTNFTNQESHSWTGEFTSIKPNQSLVYKDKFDDPNLP